MSILISKIKKISNFIPVRRLVLAIVMLAAFLIFYGLNKLYPIYLDDWDHSFIFWGDGKVHNLFDAFQSQVAQYKFWGGRAMLHVILQMLLSWGTYWSDLLNSIALVLFVSIIYLIANLENRTRPALWFFIIMLLWFFQSDVGETMIWLTGSVNYMWGALILFSFIYPFYKYFLSIIKNKPKKDNVDTHLRCTIFFFFGIVAGWTNENMIVATMCILTIFLFVIWQKEKTLYKWAIGGYIGSAIGGVLMIIAPGNYVRYNSELKDMGLTKADIGIDFYTDRLQVLATEYMHYLLPLLIAYMVLILLFWFTSKSKFKKQILASSLLFFTGSIIATLAMVATPVLAPRAWFGIITFVIVATTILYANLDFKKGYIQVLEWALIIFFLASFIQSYAEGKTELTHLRNIIDTREIELNKQKAEGKTRIVFGGERFEDREHRRLDLVIPKMYDFPQDTAHWMFKAYERYHGVEAVRFENEHPIKR